MRILHAYKIYLADMHGGIPHVIATLSRLSRTGNETFVLVARRFGFGRSYRDEGVSVRAVASFGAAFSTPIAPSYPFRLARCVKTMDVVVCHAPFPLVDIGVAFGFPDRAALVVHWHADLIGRPLLTRLVAPLIRRTLARADRIVVSAPIMIENSKFLKPFVGKCVVVPYGCDVAYWSELDELQRAEVDGLKARYPRLVVAVGRLVSYKGFDVLVRAMQVSDAQAVIIGEGPLKSELEALASKLGILHKVKFVGRQPRDVVKQYLHAAQAVVFPSVTNAEAFGLVQLEAMSAGRPVINTMLATAVPHVCRDGLEGLTVTPNQPTALADAIRRLLDDPELAGRLGYAAQARARVEYGYQLFLDRIQAIYTEAVDQRNLARSK
jgi:glycosyltransferase involved in cell wall biosynthesis